MDQILRIKQQAEDKARLELEQSRHNQTVATLTSIDTTIVDVMQRLVNYLDGKITKTEVVNQIESVATPDVAKVVEAISELGIITESNRIDLEPLKVALLALGEKLDQLPKNFPKIPKEVSVSNFPDYPEQKEIDLSPVIKAIEKIKMVAEAPNVNVDAPDLSKLEKGLANVVKSINSIKFPALPTTDLTKVEKKLDTSNKLLKKIVEKPVGGGGSGSSWPAINSDGIAQPLNVDQSGDLLTKSTISGNVSVQSPNEALKLTESGNYTYVAKAPVGTLESAAAWKVFRIDETTGLKITWADGNANYDNVATNLTTLTYS